MSEKDFLSQFSSDGKTPDSFKEEERIPVEKPKKNINPKAIIIAAIVLAVLAVGSYFLFFAPKIEMPDFVGQTKTDVASWVKQQDITSSGIVFKEEYSFDYDEDVIMSQDVEAGKKVKNDVKVTFTISKGADPDEKISVPDLKSMTKSEIESWISTNKLSKTKITTTYNDSVDKDAVISYEIKGVDEADFTRSSTLNISISKGPQPAGTVTVTDFKGKSYSEAESWAKSNKVNLVKQESFSSSVESGNIISQSISANSTMKTTDTLTVVVSKGKGVTLPNFSSMTQKQYESWKTKNPTVTLDEQEIYSSSSSYIVSQSVQAGSMVGSGDSVTVVVNLGTGFYYTKECAGYTTYDALVDWANTDAKEKGLNVAIEKVEAEDSSPRGTILGVWDITDGTKSYSSVEKLPLTVKIFVKTSTGYESTPAEVTEYTLTESDINTLNPSGYVSYTTIREWISNNSNVITGIERECLDEDESCTVDSTANYTVDHFEKKDELGTVVKYPATAGTTIPVGSTMILKDATSAN